MCNHSQLKDSTRREVQVVGISNTSRCSRTQLKGSISRFLQGVEEKKEVCNMIEKMKYKLSLVLSSIASSHFSLLCIRKSPQP